MNANRRCFLRGLGGTVTLPFLGSLSSATPNQTSGRTRVLVVGNPFGMHPQHFFPSDFGKDFTLVQFDSFFGQFWSNFVNIL